MLRASSQYGTSTASTKAGGKGSMVGSSTCGGGGDSTVLLIPNTSSMASMRHSAEPKVPVSMPVTRTTI